MIMMLLIPRAESASNPCGNSFPKIFGGQDGHSNLEHMNAFDDYLAMSGFVSGNSLIGSASSLPFIAVA
jgi:hypothetical protein